jgi:acetyltransferase-like isoleucine patch superfamily enzyme
MSRLRTIFKVLCYKLRYGKSIQWDAALRCKRISEIKLLSGKLKIGKGFGMNTGSYIAIVDNGNVSIGDNVSINRNSMIISHDAITIGNGCSIGPNVLIYDHDHIFGPNGIEKGYKTAPVLIGDNCWIGGGAIILRGTTIGDGCVIGAGAIVKGNIPPYSLVISDRELVIRPMRENHTSIS